METATTTATHTTTVLQQPFRGRKLVLATMHGKEQVLAPILQPALQVTLSVPDSLDTDEWGTFNGEVERTGSPLEVARKKCEAAHRLAGETLVLASEGSFGAHPVLGFVPAAEEWLLLKDFDAHREYKAKIISTGTNFSGNSYHDWEDAIFFAVQAGFPSHGLIVRKSQSDLTEIHKGIRDWERLKESFYYFQKKHGQAYLETDMRAMHNPTRMKAIGEAAQRLLEVIHTLCPLCAAPGFEVTQVVRGLLCADCGTPTQTAKAYVHLCAHCGHKESRMPVSQKKKENPMFCDRCNP